MINNETMMYSNIENDKKKEAEEIIVSVLRSLEEKGYDPINQIVGYILSGDPTYITNHNNARGIIRRLERDELLEEILRFYIQNKK
jgi:uncharacterized protein (UPF0297 family)